MNRTMALIRSRQTGHVQMCRIGALSLAHAFDYVTSASMARALSIEISVAGHRLRELERDGLLRRWRVKVHAHGAAIYQYGLTDRGRAVLVDRAALWLVEGERAS